MSQVITVQMAKQIVSSCNLQIHFAQTQSATGLEADQIYTYIALVLTGPHGRLLTGFQYRDGQIWSGPETAPTVVADILGHVLEAYLKKQWGKLSWRYLLARGWLYGRGEKTMSPSWSAWLARSPLAPFSRFHFVKSDLECRLCWAAGHVLLQGPQDPAPDPR